MKTVAYLAWFACACTLAFGQDRNRVQNAHFSSAADNSDRPREREVDALFAEYAGSGSPGAAVGIYRGSKIVYARGYGWADLEQRVPITTQTRLHVASISKQFTAFAIALLAHEGKLNLDADIRKYLPYVPDFGHTITIRHLLHHTSGMRDQWNLFVIAGHEIESLLRQQFVLNLVRRQRELNFPPGDDFSYCNTGYTLLAEIVQVASGLSLRQFTTERIFAPLGMTRTFFYDDVSEIVPDRAHSYQRKGPTWKRVLLNYDNAGATSLLTTVDDLARWAANLAVPMVGNAALLAEATTPLRLKSGTGIPYGFGLMLSPIDGRRTIQHSGADAAFRAHFAYFPDDDLAVAVLANTPFDVTARLARIANIYLGSTDLEPPRPAGPEWQAGVEGVYLAAQPYYSSVEIEHRDGGYWLKTGDGRQPLLLRHDERLIRGDVQYGNSYRVMRRDVSVVGLEWSGPLQLPVLFERTSGPTSSRESMTEFSGDYRSSELDITYQIEAQGGSLVAQSLWHAKKLAFREVAVDRFESANGTTLVFERDGRRPIALRVNTPRTRGVLFERVSAPSAATAVLTNASSP